LPTKQTIGEERGKHSQPLETKRFREREPTGSPAKHSLKWTSWRQMASTFQLSAAIANIRTDNTERRLVIKNKI